MKSDEQSELSGMLRESAQDFAKREKDLRSYRERMGKAPGFDAERFGTMLELGWRSALVPEELGGAGMGLAQMCAIAEELGRGLCGDVLLATSALPIFLLTDAAAQPAAAGLLRSISDGSTVPALAWQEQPGTVDPEAIQTRAGREGGEYVLNGEKRWIFGGAAATEYLVSANLDAGVAVFRVKRDAPGMTVGLQWQVDGTAAASIKLDSVRISADALVVDAWQGDGAMVRAIDAAAVVASAELNGVAHTAFDMTVEYLKTRVQFGKPIGSFQALQHKAVDLLVQRELAASVLEEAVAVFGQDSITQAQRGRIASRCKARCSDAALRITRECIQLHGAIGYTHEYDLGLYLKRALVLAAWLGNSAQHRARHLALASD